MNKKQSLDVTLIFKVKISTGAFLKWSWQLNKINCRACFYTLHLFNKMQIQWDILLEQWIKLINYTFKWKVYGCNETCDKTKAGLISQILFMHSNTYVLKCIHIHTLIQAPQRQMVTKLGDQNPILITSADPA